MIYLLRFFTGYVLFSISGSRTGSFLNRLMRCGITVWGIRPRGGKLYCCASLRDYPEIQSLTKGTSQRVHIVKKRGLPFIIRRNRRRRGLIVGAALFLAVFKALSMFLWTIDICPFDTISRSSAMDVFGRLGIYEGVRANFESLKRMQTKAMLEFGDLSWLTINVDGSRGEINATEKIAPETSDTAPQNMTAKTDGQIVRIDAYSGMPEVSAGDGVVKGDVLISGVVETELGGRRIVRAEGIALARTHRDDTFELPKKRRIMTVSGSPTVRYAARVFGLIMPLTADTVPEESVSITFENQAEFFGERASASLIKENVYAYKAAIVDTDRKTAEQLFKKRLILNEVFCHREKDIIERRVNITELENGFRCTVDYTFEENIAVPSRLTRADTLGI